jgi:putative transposase
VTITASPRRRSLRLGEYDYAQPGAYFVTAVAQNRECLFGEIESEGTIRLSLFGRIVERAWLDLSNHYRNVELDAFCIMPNHIHGIIVITAGRGGSRFG